MNFKLNKMRLLAQKRMAEKKAIRDMWKSQGGFQPTEDALKEAYKPSIKPEDCPF